MPGHTGGNNGFSGKVHFAGAIRQEHGLKFAGARGSLPHSAYSPSSSQGTVAGSTGSSATNTCQHSKCAVQFADADEDHVTNHFGRPRPRTNNLSRLS